MDSVPGQWTVVTRRRACSTRRSRSSHALRRGPLDLAGLQEATGLPRATAHRLAVALEEPPPRAARRAGPVLPRLRARPPRPGRRRGVPARRAGHARRSPRCATAPARACSSTCARTTPAAASCRCSRSHAPAVDRARGRAAAAGRRLGRARCSRGAGGPHGWPRASRSASRASPRSAPPSSTARARWWPPSASAARSSG